MVADMVVHNHGDWVSPISPTVRADQARDSAVYRFKREFLLTIASRDGAKMNVGEAWISAAQAAELLFPVVTKENAAEYLNRAW